MAAYYDSFLYNTRTPFNEYLEGAQAFIDDSFDNASSYYTDIGFEEEFGTLEFKQINARVVSLINSKDGSRINDDYRKIIFSDLQYEPVLGTRYQFDNNVWMIYSTDNVKSIHSSCYVRRCNNTINTLDEFGNLHEEPCVLDIKPTKSGVNEYEYMSVPNARTKLLFQKNKWTENLFINSRIMFDKQVYKIGVYTGYNRSYTFDKNSNGLITCYLDDDLINQYDNLELQIADYGNKMGYSIKVPQDLEVKINSIGSFTIEVYKYGTKIEEEVQFGTVPEGFITINSDGSYTTSAQEGEVEVRVSLKSNPEIFSTFKVNIAEVPMSTYENVILPDLDYIRLNQSVTFKVSELYNGTITPQEFSIEASGMGNKYYKLERDGNDFTITNLIQNENNLLKITCINLRDGSTVEKYIELGGLF